MNYQKIENRNLEDKNDKLIKEIKDLKYMNEGLEESHNLLKGILNKRKDEHLDLVTYLTKQVNSKDSTISNNFKEITDDLYKRNLISSKERKIIFNPPRLFTKSEINKALSSINKEMDESAEKYYQINQNKNDYSI